MAYCELCGIETNKTKKVLIVGSEMDVCLECSKKGKSLEKKNDISKIFYNKKRIESTESVMSNYIEIINSEMSKKSLDIHKLARLVNMKESILSKILLGKLNLDVNTAKRIEKFLKVKLVEKLDVEMKNSNLNENLLEEDNDEPSLSLGDLLLKELEKNKKNGN
jgi:putative transcription factor